MNDTSKVDIASLFPTPLAKVLIPAELSVACNFLDQTPMLHDKQSKGEYGVHSENTYIMDEPECAELKNYILKHVTDFGRNILMYGYEEYVFSQTWVSWKEPGQFHTAHTHPNSVISGVFFYGHGEEKTPAIHFHKDESQGGSCQSIMLKEKRVKNGSPFSWKTFVVNFKPGILDPEAEAIKKTLKNMGYKSVRQIVKGKFFDIEVKDGKDYLKDIEKISKDLLSNPVIENFKIIKSK